MSSFGFINGFLEKWSFVLDGVLGGYCHGTGVDRSTWRVLPMIWGGHVRLPANLSFEGVSPFPRDFAKSF
jgi:hypothetical protein